VGLALMMTKGTNRAHRFISRPAARPTRTSVVYGFIGWSKPLRSAINSPKQLLRVKKD
jgi:hypothetical protein